VLIVAESEKRSICLVQEHDMHVMATINQTISGEESQELSRQTPENKSQVETIPKMTVHK
jgi:stalled ribosome rescue protein Dom34